MNEGLRWNALQFRTVRETPGGRREGVYAHRLHGRGRCSLHNVFKMPRGQRWLSGALNEPTVAIMDITALRHPCDMILNMAERFFPLDRWFHFFYRLWLVSPC